MFGASQAIPSSGKPDDQLRLIVDNLPAMVWTARPDGFREFVNKRWLEYTGLRPEQALGANFEIVHPEDRQDFLAHWERAVQFGTPMEREVRLCRADGEYFWFLHRIVPIRDDSGSVLIWIATLTDVHSLKRSEESLGNDRQRIETARRQTAEHYRNVVETAPDAVVGVDHTSTILFVNPAAARTFGYGISELVGQPLIILMPEFMRKLHTEGFERYLKTGTRHFNWQGTELVGLRKNGEQFPIEVCFGQVVNNGHRFFTGFIRDITERKRAEQTLRQNEAYLAAAQSLTRTGSFGWNVSSDEIHWSGEIFRIFEFDPAIAFTNELILQRTHPEDRAMVQRAMNRASTEGKDYDFEHRLQMPDNSIKHVRVVGRLSKTDNPSDRQFVGAVTDITELKRAEQELQQLVDLVPQVIVVLDSDGNWIYVNRVGREYTGLTLEEFQSQVTVGRIIHPEDLETTRAARERGLAGSEPFELDTRFLGKDGIYRWYLARYNPLVEEGRVRRWYVSATEIESRKQEEERVRQENVRLEERTRIAQELHDTLLQTFLSALMQLNVAVDDVSPDSLAKPQFDRI